MKIVIIGAGFTGIQLAKLLINEKNEVVIIDNNEEVMRHAANFLDCTTETVPSLISSCRRYSILR